MVYDKAKMGRYPFLIGVVVIALASTAVKADELQSDPVRLCLDAVQAECDKHARGADNLQCREYMRKMCDTAYWAEETPGVGGGVNLPR